jgi:hypothetical protein
VRLSRARSHPAGILVLAASFLLLTASGQLFGQYPIRQFPRGWGMPAAQSPGRVPANVLPAQQATPGAHTASTGTPPLPAVGRVVVPEKDGISYGSGTLVDARGQFGLVVTNWHVVRDASGQITVEFPDGFKSPAQVVKTDKDWDLAALSVYRPNAAPINVTASPPQPGEWLSIAGYGGGSWRTASGRCTQYLAPGVEFPHEMVELAAEARQGDSGGPILNERGELAGVLFGSGPGYTSGSYGGRVLKFLATVVPGGTPANEEQAIGGAQASVPPIAPPQATALHETKPLPAPTPSDNSTVLTPVMRPASDLLLSPPAKNDIASRFALRPSTDEINPRAAIEPSRFMSNESALAAAGGEGGSLLPTTTHVPLPPRAGEVAAGAVDLQHAPPSQLLSVLWRQVGGPSLIDQVKTTLAGVGVLAIVVLFWRLKGKKEPEHEEE